MFPNPLEIGKLVEDQLEEILEASSSSSSMATSSPSAGSRDFMLKEETTNRDLDLDQFKQSDTNWIPIENVSH